MAYSDGSENMSLLRRTITGTFDFTGRSRRLEVVYYAIAAALLSTVLNFAIATSLPERPSFLARELIDVLLSLPTFALFARRLRDQDRGGWWMLLPATIFCLNLFFTYQTIAGISPYERERPPFAFALFVIVIMIATFVLHFLPGTAGDNRFGSDPRLEEQPVTA